jgi:hypothetical protein
VITRGSVRRFALARVIHDSQGNTHRRVNAIEADATIGINRAGGSDVGLHLGEMATLPERTMESKSQPLNACDSSQMELLANPHRRMLNGADPDSHDSRIPSTGSRQLKAASACCDLQQETKSSRQAPS